MNQPRIGAAAPTAASTAPSNTPDLEIEDLTRDQRTVLGKITSCFREAGVVQVLTGPRESGKTTVAEMVARCLDNETVAVVINKSLDQPPAQKRLMQEAYGSYTQMLGAILRQTGFYARGEEADLVEQMVERLRMLRQENKRLLLILDDAHDITPGVWKRMQSWLDYQDRGLRMFQVLLVGSPMLRKMMGEPILRGWRRWTHGAHDLKLLRWGHAAEETRRVLKRSCDLLNARSGTESPLTPPRISWFAIRKVVKEASGRPGRLQELVRRALSASIRQGGVSITRKFLHQADALRSPAMQASQVKKVLKSRDAEKASEPAPKERSRPSVSPATQSLNWMKYSLGVLLVLFIIGAGWGVHAWLKTPSSDSTAVVSVESPGTDAAIDEVPISEEPAAPSETVQQVASVQPAVSVPDQVDSFLSSDLIPASTASEAGDIWNPIDEVAHTRTDSDSMENSLNQLQSSLPQTQQASTTIPSSAGQTAPPTGSTLPAPALQMEPEIPVPPVASAPPAAPSGDSLVPVMPAAPQQQSVPQGGSLQESLPDSSTIALGGKPKEPEILRLNGPEQPSAPAKSVEPEKSNQSAPAQKSKPRLSRKTLEALSRLEKKLR
ncbi:MAG: hypothetical protein AMXMBFR75_06330 [Candidatus Hinthialibacteria bacterium]